MEHYLNLFIQPIFSENFALSSFLGMCTFISFSKKIEDATRMGFMVLLAMAVTTPMNCLLYQYILKSGAWSWAGHPEIDLSFLGLLCYIGVIVATVKIAKLFVKKYFQQTYLSLATYIEVVTLNCVILSASLLIVERDYDVIESTIFGIGGGIGWMLAILAMAGISEKMKYSDVPLGLRQLGISSIVAGLLAMAFMSISKITI